MPLVSGQVASASGFGTSVAVAYPGNTTAGNLLVCGHCGGATDSSVTATSQTTAEASANDDTTNNLYTSIHYVENCTATGVTWTRNHASADADIAIAEYDGIVATGTLDVEVSTAQAFSTSADSGDATTTVPDALLIGLASFESAGSPGTATGSFTEDVESTGQRPVLLMSRIVTAIGTYKATATLAATPNWTCSMAAFEAVTPTIVLTGTAVGGITEADVVAGGKTIIATVTGDTYVPAASQQTIEYIANGLGGTTTTTSFTITIPTVQTGDLMILEFCHRGTGDGTVSDDGSNSWTRKGEQLFATSAFSGQQYYSRALSTDSAKTITVTILTDACAGILTVYRGVLASGDPFDGGATIVGEQNASGNETQAQITTLVDGCMVCLVVLNSPDLAIATQNCTSPGALAERAERLSTGGTDASISHASALKASAGATGALTWTQGNAASGSYAYALQPVATTPFDTARQAVIDGIDSAQAEGTGWDALRSGIAVTAVVRTSATVVTVTIPALASYDITATETLTHTMPASVLVAATARVATPTMTITAGGGAADPEGSLLRGKLLRGGLLLRGVLQ